MLTLRHARCLPANPAKKHVPCHTWLIEVPEAPLPVGVITLRLGNPETSLYYPGHIGYRIRKPHRGHSYASRALQQLLPEAKKLGITELWISCRPDNHASRKTAERNGATLHETVPIPEDHEMYAQGYRHACRYLIRTQ